MSAEPCPFEESLGRPCGNCWPCAKAERDEARASLKALASVLVDTQSKTSVESIEALVRATRERALEEAARHIETGGLKIMEGRSVVGIAQDIRALSSRTGTAEERPNHDSTPRWEDCKVCNPAASSEGRD